MGSEMELAEGKIGLGRKRSRRLGQGRKLSEDDGEGDGQGVALELVIPFMLMLSPKWASARISAQSEMVSEVPPPPAALSSCFSRRVTAGCVSLAMLGSRTGKYREGDYCL